MIASHILIKYGLERFIRNDTISCEITSFDLDTIARDAFKDLDRSEELLHKTLIKAGTDQWTN